MIEPDLAWIGLFVLGGTKGYFFITFGRISFVLKFFASCAYELRRIREFTTPLPLGFCAILVRVDTNLLRVSSVIDIFAAYGSANGRTTEPRSVPAKLCLLLVTVPCERCALCVLLMA